MVGYILLLTPFLSRVYSVGNKQPEKKNNKQTRRYFWGQWLIKIQVNVQSLKSSNIGLGKYLDNRLFKCRSSVAANP